jgi:hypothetical protein
VRPLGILATVLLICAVLQAHATERLDIGVAMGLIDQGVSNLRKWQSPDAGNEKPGLPVQFINLSKGISVLFTAKGAVSCEHQDLGPWKEGTPPHVTLSPGHQSYCKAGKESSAPFAVWWLFAGENKEKPLINVDRGSNSVPKESLRRSRWMTETRSRGVYPRSARSRSGRETELRLQAARGDAMGSRRT